MKATGLMIGDWVNYSILNLNAKVFSTLGNHTIGIQFVDNNNKVEAIHGLLEETINPIPLTEEILVKNGFEKRIHTSLSNNEDYRYYQWNPTPEYPDEGVWLWPNGDSYTYNSRISDIKINSVHQLQHLLRLCGVEKELVID